MEPIRYQISEADYLRFWKLATGRGFKICMIVLGGYLLFIIAVNLMVGPSNVLFWIAVLVSVLIVFAALQRLVAAPRMLRAIYGEDARIKEPVSLTIDGDGFTQTFPSGQLTSKWSDMVKWHENDAIFIVFANRQQGYVLPKAQISTNVIDTVREHLVANGLPKQNRLKK